jgi:NAD(P)-dependent dehydrogenase (short-subunit alcohol dehydrogenase family)
MSFAGKVAIVTGAGEGGIGEGIATGLAQAGCKVVVADINEKAGAAALDKLKAAGHDAIFQAVDISSPDSAQALADKAAAQYGRIDFLVNNAALFGGMAQGGFVDMDWAALKRQFDINILGGVCVTRAVVPHMDKAGGGAIVFTSSTASWMGGGHYGVAKLAVNGIVISLSRELGGRNIRVNAIAPGMTDTPAMRQNTPEHWIQAGMAQLAIKRFATPQDHANVVKFLLSDEASFVTGQILAVDGGSLPRP